jgi:hypothetical protein
MNGNGTGRLPKRFCGLSPGAASANEEKAIRVGNPVGAAEIGRARGHGVAMGLAFALILMVMDPSGIAALVQQEGNQVGAVGTLMLTFGIGAALTGAVFMMTEDG